MRIVVAPDKFKGTLSALAAARAIADGIHRVRPDAEILLCPLADGGEGTVDAALLAGGREQHATVTGPLGDPVVAVWSLDDSGVAVLESAAASGLHLVDPSPDSARSARGDGIGELIRAALDSGAQEIILGLGGVAITDGGSGALRALGARILDAHGDPVAPGGAALAHAATLDLSGLDPRLTAVSLRLAVDVDNPLTGPAGAAAIFAPQKGADAAAVAELAAALEVWAGVLERATGIDADVPGAGAAGGLAAAFLAATPATCEPGSALVADLVGFEAALDGADLLIVGEGSLDAQSLGGKAPVAAARRAQARGIAVVAIAGIIDTIALTPERCADVGIGRAIALVDLAPSVASARADAAHWLSVAGEQALTS